MPEPATLLLFGSGLGAVAARRRRANGRHLRVAEMPPLRLLILEDVAAHPGARTGEVRSRIDKPRSTADRQLQALHMLGVLTVDERRDPERQRSSWFYFLADAIDPSVLVVPDLLLTSHKHSEREEQEETVPFLTYLVW